MGKSVGIIGAGAWGTAVGKVVADKRDEAGAHAVEIWSHTEAVTAQINSLHENRTYLPGVQLPASIRASCSLEAITSEKDFLLLATPSLYLPGIVRRMLRVDSILDGHPVIGVLTKGFVGGDRGPRLIIEAMEEQLPGFYRENIVYVSGPSHAEEVAAGKLTGLICASGNPRNAIRFRHLLSSAGLMIFPSLDVVGVQISAAVKNVVAIAFGVLDALKELTTGLGDNTESLLLAAGLNEIQRLAFAMGATHAETFTSIAGVGDLDVTCRSPYGRNRRFGREIVLKGIIDRYTDIDDLIEHLDQIGYLPEGVVAARSTQMLTTRYGLKMPILGGVFRVLNRESEPVNAIRTMLESITRAEFTGESITLRSEAKNVPAQPGNTRVTSE